MMAPVYLVDASIYIFRSYFSIPSTFVAANGELVNAVYGYTNFVLDLLEHEPQCIAFAFDESLVTCYRNAIYPEYKANRELPDANLEFQLAQCQRLTSLMGLCGLSLEDYEADDIIGSLARRFGVNRDICIVTRDKDLGQLLRKHDQLWDFAADVRLGPDDVAEKFGVLPNQLADFLALAGDPVDNIPGAPGIGSKTAAVLLGEFESLDKLLSKTDQVRQSGIRAAARIAETLERHRSEIEMYRQVTAIHCEVPMDIELGDLAPSKPDAASLREFCDEMAFGQRIRQRIEARTHD